MRSQLDCHDPWLPRRTFDLKTRAVLPVRMDVANYSRYRDYRLVKSHGLYCSFEREYYDMCRSALLKYNFQVRIGDMDGIFVAYHNTHEIFGFQYISREEMDERIFGNSVTGDAAFNLILQVYNSILSAIVPSYPRENTVRLTFVVDRTGSRLTIFSEDLGPRLTPSKDGEHLGEDQEEVNSAQQVGVNIRQFTLTLRSLVNGFREEQALLNEQRGDRWGLTGNLTQGPLIQSEFDSARAKATMVGGSATSRVENDDERGGMANFLRIINENSIQRAGEYGDGAPQGDVIAPWTII